MMSCTKCARKIVKLVVGGDRNVRSHKAIFRRKYRRINKQRLYTEDVDYIERRIFFTSWDIA